MNCINYSIIIPHYNCPEKLQRCIDSIPCRNDLEIIIVDDNSSPNIVDFNIFPGIDRDEVIIIKTTEGKGAGYARNQGLVHSRGKWLLFSDSDDEFYTEILSDAMDRHINSSADIIYFNADVIDAETLVIDNNRLKFHQHICGGSQADIEWLRYNLSVPWGKFLKKELVVTNNIYFDEVIAGNDVMFSLKSGHMAKSVIIDNHIIYKWYVYKIGNISSMMTMDAANAKFSVALRRLDYLTKCNKLEYRSNLFITYVLLYKKAGLSTIEAYFKVLKHTPIKYRIIDTYNFILLFIRKRLHK